LKLSTVALAVGVRVAVGVGVNVGVLVGTTTVSAMLVGWVTAKTTEALVGLTNGVFVAVGVSVGVFVTVGVNVTVGVLLGVALSAGVADTASVKVAVATTGAVTVGLIPCATGVPAPLTSTGWNGCPAWRTQPAANKVKLKRTSIARRDVMNAKTPSVSPQRQALAYTL